MDLALDEQSLDPLRIRSPGGADLLLELWSSPLTELGGVRDFGMGWDSHRSETIVWTIQTKRIIKRQKNPSS